MGGGFIWEFGESGRCFFYCRTNIGPILVELIVKHIIPPQCCKSRILEDLTEIYIKVYVAFINVVFVKSLDTKETNHKVYKLSP